MLKFTYTELISAEIKARQAGDIKEGDRLRALRWQHAMSLVLNSENTARRKPEDQQ